MSLTLEGFIAASERFDEMEKRLERLFGFSPATSDHYGRIHMYGEVIDGRTTDEMLCDLRRRYLEWKRDLLALFAECGAPISNEELREYIHPDVMWGGLTLFGDFIKIDRGVEPHRERIEKFAKCRAEGRVYEYWFDKNGSV